MYKEYKKHIQQWLIAERADKWLLGVYAKSALSPVRARRGCFVEEFE